MVAAVDQHQAGSLPSHSDCIVVVSEAKAVVRIENRVVASIEAAEVATGIVAGAVGTAAAEAAETEAAEAAAVIEGVEAAAIMA